METRTLLNTKYIVREDGAVFISSTGKRLTTRRIKTGIKVSLLDDDNKVHRFDVRDLVATCYLPLKDVNEVDGIVVNLDFNTRNNHYTNLQWIDTYSDNAITINNDYVVLYIDSNNNLDNIYYSPQHYCIHNKVHIKEIPNIKNLIKISELTDIVDITTAYLVYRDNGVAKVITYNEKIMYKLLKILKQ